MWPWATKAARLTRWNERIASATPTSLRLKSIQCLMISAATSASKRWLTGFFLPMSDKSWQQTRSELEPFLKGQPDNYLVIGDLALTNMALGDKGPALALSEQAMTVVPLEKDAVDGPAPIEVLARVAARMGEPDRPSPRYGN